MLIVEKFNSPGRWKGGGKKVPVVSPLRNNLGQLGKSHDLEEDLFHLHLLKVEIYIVWLSAQCEGSGRWYSARCIALIKIRILPNFKEGEDWAQPDLRIIRLVLQWLQGLDPEDKGPFQQISPPFQMADSWRYGPALPGPDPGQPFQDFLLYLLYYFIIFKIYWIKNKSKLQDS